MKESNHVRQALAVAIAAATGSIFTPVFADNQYALEEIVVTAQKRAESLQDVPISINAISGEKLKDAGIQKIQDLAAYVPNLHMTETGISTQIRVRGIGSGNDQGFEQSVGQYIDGIYYGRAPLIRAPFLDLERVEALRGPQSILFGKNSIAGALNMTTAKPTDELEGSISVTYEPEYNQREVNTVISGPLSDRVRGRLAYRSYEEDGYVKNTFLGRDEPVRDEDAIRATLQWDVTSDMTVTFKAERDTFDVKGRQIEIIMDETDFSGTLAGVYGTPSYEHDLNYKRQADADEYSENELENYTLTLDYSLGENTLVLVTGWVSYDLAELCDCDFSPVNLFTGQFVEEYEQFSQEVRLISPGGETVDWITGMFYQRTDQDFEDKTHFNSSVVVGAPALLAGTAALREFTQKSDAWSVFGQATWNVTDQLRATLGGRYSYEEKEGTRSINIIPVDQGDDARVAAAAPVWEAFGVNHNQFSSHDLGADRTEPSFTPLINVQYDLDQDTLLYASYTTGFKSGGFSTRGNNIDSFEFDEEKATSFEIGAKSTFADGAAELNLAYFYTEYEDLQISQFDGAIGFNVGNAKESVVQGVELDGRWMLVENLTLSYAASYLDFEYKDFSNGNCYRDQTPDGDILLSGARGCDYTGKSAQFTPKKTLNLGLVYFHSLSNTYDMHYSIDTLYESDQDLDDNLDPRNHIGGVTIVNARIALETDNWSLAMVGKNLTDDDSHVYGGKAPLAPAGTEYAFVKRPRSVAVEGRYKF